MPEVQKPVLEHAAKEAETIDHASRAPLFKAALRGGFFGRTQETKAGSRFSAAIWRFVLASFSKLRLAPRRRIVDLLHVQQVELSRPDSLVNALLR